MCHYALHPRFAIDNFLGLPSNNCAAKSKQDYSDIKKEQLQYAYMTRPSKNQNKLWLSTRSTMTGTFNMLFFNLEIMF